MGRPVKFDFSTGGGSEAEFFIGTVHIIPTLMHVNGPTIVLPDEVKPLLLINGKALHEDMEISPDGPEPAWAYKFIFRSGVTKRSWSEYRGVPAGTGVIDYKSLPVFQTTVPPGTTPEMLQSWVATTELNALRAEDAADRAEAPTDQMNANLIGNHQSLTYQAMSGAFVTAITTEHGTTFYQNGVEL